jgi:excisionase family DNA binding protein
VSELGNYHRTICHPPDNATQVLGVNERTLRRWAEEGKIEFIKTPSGQRRYNIQGYTTQFVSDRTDVIYARVSSKAQKPDLERQVAALSSRYPEAEIISEIGGGLNFKRKVRIVLAKV